MRIRFESSRAPNGEDKEPTNETENVGRKRKIKVRNPGGLSKKESVLNVMNF